MHELDGLVTGDADRQVGGQYFGLADARVARCADALRQARVAVLGFFEEGHLLPSGLVGEGCAVGHEVGVDHLACQSGPALRGHQGVCRRVVVDVQAVVELDGQDVFVRVGIFFGKERQVVALGVSGVVQAVLPVVHQLLGRCGCLLQVVGVVVAFERYAVVLPVSAFVEAELRLQRHGCVAVHAEGAAGLFGLRGEVLDGVVDVLNHVRHDQLARVAGLVERFVGRAQLDVVPGHVAEAFHLLEVEEGAEEAGQGGVLRHGRLVVTLVDVGQQGVHLAQVGPRPSSARCGGDAVRSAQDFVGQGLLHVQVALVVVGRLVQQVVVEGVAEELEVALRLEVVGLRDIALRVQVEQVVARGEPHGQGHCCYECSFHIFVSLESC